MKLNLDELFQQIRTGEDSGAEHDKVAEAQFAEDVVKLAEELRAGGHLFGDAAAESILSKLAEGVPAGGGGVEPRSAAEQIADAIAKAKGKTSAMPGDDTSVRAEANPTPGAKGVVNPATAFG
jgi:hypothetical protein